MGASSGEGSRGGQVIGHTSSGKPIYASHLNSTGRMAHAATVAQVAGAGAARPAVFQVTHGSDGQRLAPGKYSSARETFEVGPSGRKIGRTMNPVAPRPKLPPLREGAAHPHSVWDSIKHMPGMGGSNATRPAVLNKPGYRGR